MRDRANHDARKNKEDESGEQRVTASKDFTPFRVRTIHRAHAAEQHRRVQESINR
jgi:hypothetical protein